MRHTRVQNSINKPRLPKAMDVFWLLIEIFPVLLPAAVGVFGATGMIFLLLGEFKPVYIWSLGTVSVAILGYFLVINYPRDNYLERTRRTWNLLLIIAVFCWGGFNMFFTAQHVFVNRDPGVYTDAGIWLMKHESLSIPTEHTFGSVSGLNIDNGTGFKQIAGSDGKTIYAQGLHLLSIYVGLAGRIFGSAKALHVNILFGMSAILSLYAVARIFVRQTWWAVTVTGILAVSMPLLYFSRDMYTEPLAATLTFGGLAMLWVAIKSNRLSVWFLSGTLLGAGTMTRIDGYLTIAEILAFAVVLLMFAAKHDRLAKVRMSLILVTGMVVTGVLGWLDAAKLSTPYYQDLAPSFRHEMLAILMVLVLGSVGIYLAWRTKLIAKTNRITAVWRSEAVAAGLIMGIIVLLVRPYLYRAVGMVDPISTYDAYSTGWVTWYVGAFTTAIGVLGILLATNRALKRHDPLLTAILFVVIGTSVVYLIQPSIYPDQIWASRRMLPVIMPGLLVFVAFALEWLTEKFGGQIVMKKTFMALTSVALLAVPAVISKPALLLRPYHQLGAVQSICDSLPTRAAIVWVGSQSHQEIVQPVRSVCDLPSQSLTLSSGESSPQETLALIARNARDRGKLPIVGIYGQADKEIPADVAGNLKLLTTNTYSDLEHTYLNAPQKTNDAAVPIYLGMIQPDGRIIPLQTHK